MKAGAVKGTHRVLLVKLLKYWGVRIKSASGVGMLATKIKYWPSGLSIGLDLEMKHGVHGD